MRLLKNTNEDKRESLNLNCRPYIIRCEVKQGAASVSMCVWYVRFRKAFQKTHTIAAATAVEWNCAESDADSTKHKHTETHTHACSNPSLKSISENSNMFQREIKAAIPSGWKANAYASEVTLFTVFIPACSNSSMSFFAYRHRNTHHTHKHKQRSLWQF